MKTFFAFLLLASGPAFADELKEGPPPGGMPGGMGFRPGEYPPPPRLTEEQRKVFEACLKEKGVARPERPPEGGPPPRPPEGQREIFHQCHDKATGGSGKGKP